MKIKVLLVFVNVRGMSVIPLVIGSFTALLKQAGHTVALFDTSGYSIPGFRDETVSRQEKLYFGEANVGGNSEAAQALVGLAAKARADIFADCEAKINSFSPDLIALTVTDSTFLIAIELMKEMRKRLPDLPLTIWGGVFPTFAPELALHFPEVDMVCVGEGEKTIIALCDRLGRGEDFSGIPGIWSRRDGGIVKNPPQPILVEDELDRLPIPDYSMFEDFRFYRPLGNDGRVYRMLVATTHLGCPFTCTFCNSPSQNEMFTLKFFRKKRVERIREELAALQRKYRIEYVFFWADTFLAWSMEEQEAFCEMYQEFKLPFWCQTRPETFAPDRQGHRKLKLLMQTGMHWMSLGLEHGNEQYRKEVVDRPYSNQLIVDSIQVARDVGINYTVNNIIGFPLETRELVFDTIRLNRLIHPDPKKSNFSCSTFMPFTGTRLREVAIKNGFMPADYICPSNSARSILKMPFPYLQVEDIHTLQRRFAMYVRFPESEWSRIRRSEEPTAAGEQLYQELKREYKKRFLDQSETSIDRLPDPSRPPNQSVSLM